MLVIGIDPGIAITGYGLVETDENQQLHLIDFGVIRTSPGVANAERLFQLHQELKKPILLHQPEQAAVEKLFFQRNVKTAMLVGQAKGVALFTLAQLDLQIQEYSPMEIKIAVTGYGGADKRQVQQMVQSLLQLDQIPQPDDAADALAVAICHLHSVQMNSMVENAINKFPSG